MSLNNIIEDISKLAGNAASVALEGSKDAKDKLKEFFKNNACEMGFVSREEFEAVRLMAEKARLKNEELEKRIAELENK